MTATRHLSEVVRSGPWRIAVIEERRTAAWAAQGRIAGHATKVPLAILIDGAGGIALHAPDGATLPLSDAEALLPGALSRFAAARADEPENSRRQTKEETP